MIGSIASRFSWVVLTLATLGGASLGAQSSAPSPRSVRDGVYTQAQAQRGEATFRSICASCHVLSDFSGPTFLRRWSTVGAIFEVVSTTMPQDMPGGLTAQQYADVVAYMLSRSSLPTGPSELPKEQAALNAITVPPPPPPGR